VSLACRQHIVLALAAAALVLAVMGRAETASAQPPMQRGQTRNPHGPLKLACESCHATVGWTPLRARIEFNHDRETAYPLRGMHQNVGCRNCHTSLGFSNTSRACASCHPDFHRRQMGAQCEQCHTVRGWRVSMQGVRDHTNRFPLLGAHALAACDSCHKGAAAGVYTGLSTDCASCHLQDFRQAKNVDHQAAGLPLTCATCHSIDRWQGAKFDHNQFGHFPLVGAHAKLECASCHLSRQFTGTPSDCFSCHAAAFVAAKNPPHAASGFPHDCAVCHSMEKWQGAAFDHTAITKFTLTGAHTSVACTSCHVAGRFAGTPTACYGCHTAQFESAGNPDHKGGGFPTTCELCHNTAKWTGAKFDHAQTRFPLTGRHTSVGCVQCHVGNQITGTPQDCASCHIRDFDGSTNPNHKAAGFATTCNSCHDTTQWKGAKYDHNTATKFALTGKHTAVACGQCHVNNRFAGTSQDCASCHMTDFNGTLSPNHKAAGIATTCTSCHDTTQWKGAKFDHNAATKFALTGKHTAVACGQCHVNGQYAGLPAQCSSCHLAAYNSTTNPNHKSAGFPTSCETCHTTAQWQGAKFDHNTATKFVLTGKHTAVACGQCHANDRFASTPQDCATCHIDNYNATTNPNHKAAGFSTTCNTCHTTIQWTGATFDHGKTKFPLTGKHTAVACQQCHVNGQYAGLPAQCLSCHLSAYNSTTNPNHKTAGFPTSCETCHTTAQWQGAKFDHNTATRFALTGKHTTVVCTQCHVNNLFAGTPQDCTACHINNYNATTNPNHKSAGFSTSCNSCHTTTQWAGAAFDHNKTKFPLTGKHTAVTCQQCHVNGQYAGLPAQCSSCHLAAYNGTTNPNHKTAAFPTSCEMCHTTTQWQGAKFDHNTATKFPLTGKHTALTCQQCHVNGQYAGLPAQCSSCHLAAYNSTTNPNHKSAGFPTACETCHTTAQWQGAKFDHNTATKFALTGKHTTVACTQCHVNNRFAGTPQDCASCHLNNYNATTNPNHKAAGFSTTCNTCHTTIQWTGAKFDHNTATKFALTGKHTTVACTQCHANNRFAGTPQDCASCHIDNYNATTNPNHKAAGFPTTCNICHTTAQWTGATFDHSKTKFPLTGKHTAVTCQQCHTNGVYAGLPAQCSSCHLAAYNSTTNPNHKSAGFPTTCETCHTTAQWQGAKFDHNTATKFALTGKHTTVACTQCHVNNRFAGTPQDCASCHINNYNATTNPNHKAAGFPTTCNTCHTTTQWTGAIFDHSKTRFPLTGKHTSVACQQCHTNGVYAGLSALCASCHINNYNATANPNHKAAGFPTTCETCHITTQWTGAKFDHNTATKFALTGKHTTVACTQCHANNVFAGTPQDCASCHINNYNATTNPNHKAAGFPTTCNICHTTTQWTGATFDHSKTPFPLTGKHTAVTCQQCHSSGVYVGLSTQCASCHINNYNATTNPNHKTAGFPTDCSLCHNTSGWPGAVFDHSKTIFPLTGKHTTVACQQCHINGKYAGTSTACSDCHLAVYNATTNPNHKTAGFPLTCNICHSTTQWTGATFDHSKTRFPLTGAHATKATCANCHVNGVYAGTPMDCYSCHQTEYNTVTNPNHIAAGFAKTCETCHTTIQWTGAKYTHSKFPIYSGSHSGKWTTCNDCHTNPANYTIFSCTICHQHAQATVDPKHQSVKGYVYNSVNCYSCHPTGRAG
jgi:hypothetical protein